MLLRAKYVTLIYKKAHILRLQIFLLYLQQHDLFLLCGSNHELWADVLVEVLFADDLQLKRAFLKGNTLLVCVLSGFRGGIVANDRVEAGDQHQAVLLLIVNRVRG